MSARDLLDATVGRRLLVRIWLHGVLLVAGVVVTVLAATWVMSELNAAHALRQHPYLARTAAERVLAAERADLPGAVAGFGRETPLALTVYDGAGAVLASTTTPPLVAPAGAGAERWRDRHLRVDGAGGRYAVVRVPAPPSVAIHVVGLLAAALVLGFVFVAAPLTSSIARPIARLGGLARQLGAGDLGVRANSDRRDEIGDLARSFDAMAGQLQRLRGAERALVGDVSHELRTPLARMRVVLDLASDADAAEVRRYLHEVASDLAELEQLIDDLIVATRLDRDGARWDEAGPPLRRRALAIDELVDAAAARFRARWPARTLLEERTATGVVDGDPALLRRALDNLLDNARKYSPDDAPITLRVAPAGATVRLAVVDRGIGIAEADQPRIFSAFFRTDRSRARGTGGVGLGLALTRRIARAHDGTVGFTSAPDRGSTFWIELPIASASGS